MEARTERARAPLAGIDSLWASPQESRAVLDLISDSFVLFDRSWRYQFVNGPAAAALGKHPNDLIGHTLWDLYPPLPGSRTAELLQGAMDSVEPCHFQARGPNDRWYDFHCYPNVRGLAAFYHDVTEQRQAEERLHDSEQRLRFTLESANVGSWDWDLRTDQVTWSDNLEIIHGRLPGSFSGSFESVQEDMVAEDKTYVQAAIARALEEGSEYLVHYRVIKHDGSIIWVEGKGRAQYDDAGQPIRMAGICSDITDRKRAEEALRQREQELRTLNATLESRVEARTRELESTVHVLEARNQELQRFAFAASHDLQEPLRKVATFCDLLKRDAGDKLNDTDRHYIERMEDAARRMSALIRDLLSFSTVTMPGDAFETIDLGVLWTEAVADLSEQIEGTDARIEAGDLGTIEGNASEVRQLLQHLLSNALKFRRPDEAPVIQVSAAMEPLTDGSSGTAICALTIRDNGIGFDPKYADRIFAPFQRLHSRERYEGSGIGLAICRRIAERHRGTIQADSTPGVGSLFTVRLPMQQGPERAGMHA